MRAQAARSAPSEMLAVARRGRGDSLALGHHDDRRLQLLGRAPRPPPTSSGCARSSTSRCSRRDPRTPSASSPRSARGVDETDARAHRRLAARAVHLLGSTSTRGACRSASRSARTSPRARARTSGSSTAAARCSALAPLLVPPTGKRAVATLEPVLGAGPALRPLRRVCEPDEIALLAERGVPVAHCPRSNALLGCGIAPLHELRAAGVTVGLGTDSPASTPSFDMFEEMRTAIYGRAGARAAARRRCSAADALRLATIDAARALRIDGQVGTLTPGKRADLAVVSLAGSPYHPVEDPAAAVVFGGSPERVLETIVDGETRYRSEDPGPRGERYAAPQAPPGAKMLAAERSRDAAATTQKPKKQKPPQWQEELFFPRLRVHAKWVFVLLAVCLRARLRHLRRRLRLDRDLATRSRTPSTSAARGTSISSLEKKVAQAPAGRHGVARSRDGLRDEAAHRRTRSTPSSATPRCSRRTPTRSASSHPSTSLLDQHVLRPTTRTALAASSVAAPSSQFQLSTTSPFGKAFATRRRSKTRSTPRSLTQQSSEDPDARLEPDHERAPARVSTYQRLAKLHAEGRDDAAPARPGRPGGRATTPSRSPRSRSS